MAMTFSLWAGGKSAVTCPVNCPVAQSMGITSAEGIQYAGFDAGTSVFDFSDNEITDVTPFAEMMENGFHFFTLNLDNNAITDFSPFFGFTMGN